MIQIHCCSQPKRYELDWLYYLSRHTRYVQVQVLRRHCCSSFANCKLIQPVSVELHTVHSFANHITSVQWPFTRLRPNVPVEWSGHRVNIVYCFRALRSSPLESRLVLTVDVIIEIMIIIGAGAQLHHGKGDREISGKTCRNVPEMRRSPLCRSVWTTEIAPRLFCLDFENSFNFNLSLPICN